MRAPLAEITQSGLISWTAQCWDYDQAPALGALVSCQADPTIYAFVTDIACQSKNNSSQIYKKTPEQLKVEYPHLSYYFTTTLHLVPVCWQDQNTLMFQIPTKPAPLHRFIEPASEALYRQIMQSSQWLPAFSSIASNNPLFDELLLAILYQALAHNVLTRAHLEELAHTYASLTSNNYSRVKIFLQRLELLIH